MDLTLNYNGYSITETFPMNSLKLQDLADRLKTFQENPTVQFRFSEYDIDTPYVLCDKTYTADLYQINLFAERLKDLDYMQESQFVALMRVNPEAEFEDVLLMTFALDDVQVFSCKNSRELMKIAFENDFLSEFKGCSGEILELLDPEKVAEKVYRQRGGMCYNGYYCEPAEYVRPDINIKIDRLKPEIFRILVAPTKEENVPDYRFARWISLPCANKNLKSADMQSCEYQSLLPMLSACQFQIEKIHELNGLAKMISELNRHDLVKLKAVMENENIDSISETKSCIERLSEYEFDELVHDENDFGRKYTAQNLPENFNLKWFENTDMYEFGRQILDEKNGSVTSYGAVSGRGQSLYSVMDTQPEQTNSEEPDEGESEEMEVCLS